MIDGDGIDLDVILHCPEIPPNTGNVMRLCANTGCRLHLIRPLGFSLDDARMRRAGLDYRDLATVAVHDDLIACLKVTRPERLLAITTRGQCRYAHWAFAPGDALLFGAETRGLPAEVMTRIPPERRLRIPMRPGQRSLNLSNSVAIVVYEVWRQRGFIGGN